MRKFVVPAAVTIGACAACCAPLVAPWLIAAFAASGAGLALAGQVGLALAIIAGGSGYLWWRHRQSRTREAARRLASPAASCGCGPGEGCSTGDACALPPPRAR